MMLDATNKRREMCHDYTRLVMYGMPDAEYYIKIAIGRGHPGVVNEYFTKTDFTKDLQDRDYFTKT